MALFAEDERFFLTGGSALGMFYLDHRRSYDLDLFTSEEVDGMQLKNEVLRLAKDIGADCEPVMTSPDFHRFELRRGEEREILDFVVDRVPQLDEKKNFFGPIRVDTLREIIANKLAALVGRTELKDLIDLYYLEREGHDLLAGLEDAARKEAGLEPAMLSFLLDSVRLNETPEYMIDALDMAEFRAFVDRLRCALAERALPEEG